MKKKVLLGMSGGVDSSASVSKLQEMGYDVVGITFLMFKFKEGTQDYIKQQKDLSDAKKVAEIFGIEHIVEDVSNDFQKKIVGMFVDEYLNGRTPSPCVVCNRYIKFKVLIEFAEKYGCDYVATGHYAKRGYDPKYGEVILKANNPKDQSYFLANIQREYVPKILFPLQDFSTKDEVRKYIYAKLKDLGMEEATNIYKKGDSQDICFIKDNDYIKFIDKYIEDNKIENLENIDIFEGTRKIKSGDKIYSYTIGKRRGLNISSSHRLYIIDIDKEKNRINVGSKEDLNITKVYLDKPNFLVDEDKIVDDIEVKLNYNAKIRKAKLIKENGNYYLKFDDFVRKPAISQYATMYDKNVLLATARIIGSEK